MLYAIDNEFVKIAETTGTIQNSSHVGTIEMSTSDTPDSGILIYPLQKVSFSDQTIYLRCIDGYAEARVLPFELVTEGGDMQVLKRVFADISYSGSNLAFLSPTGEVLKYFNLPEEIYLRSIGTAFVPDFTWSALAYPNSVSPNLNGKPVLVLHIKGDSLDSPYEDWGFCNLEDLIDLYVPADPSIAISDNSIKAAISSDTNNLLTLKNDGLFVGSDTILDTVPATVDGGMWYEIERDYPIIKIQHGNKTYRLNKLPLLSKYEYNYCVSWLPFNSSNPLVDVFGKNWEASNGTPDMVDVSPFGTGKSVSITTDNYLTLNSLVLGGQDFTIDGWFYVISGGTYKRTLEIWRKANGGLGGVEAQIMENNGSGKWNNIAINYNQWTHCAMVYRYSANTLYTYVDGVSLGFNFLSAATSFRTRGALDQVFIGESRWHNSSGRINAYVSNFRIFDGIALWTGNFAPPTAADYGLTA